MENPTKQPEDKTTTSAETEKPKTSILKNKWVKSGGAVALALIIVGGLVYWQMSSTRIGIDTSLITAPIINLSPTAPGQLQAIYVNEGDMVAANTPVAKVGERNN